jgi:hypothetical protein
VADPKVLEYQAAVRIAALAAALLQEHDLPELLRAIDHSHAVGPILDPTLYREKAGAMELDRELLDAALPLWKLGRKRAGNLAAAKEASSAP